MKRLQVARPMNQGSTRSKVNFTTASTPALGLSNR
jgi:hypothetical protein